MRSRRSECLPAKPGGIFCDLRSNLYTAAKSLRSLQNVYRHPKGPNPGHLPKAPTQLPPFSPSPVHIHRFFALDPFPRAQNIPKKDVYEDSCYKIGPLRLIQRTRAANNRPFCATGPLFAQSCLASAIPQQSVRHRVALHKSDALKSTKDLFARKRPPSITRQTT